MENKIKILCFSIWYPLSMSRYFEKALRHRSDVDLKTVGPYTGTFIPWQGGMNLPSKYALAPDIPLPYAPSIGEVNYDMVKAQLHRWIPDLIICIDAGFHPKYKPSDGMVVTVGTDPHVLNDWYDEPRKYSDKFFNMQKVYSKKGDIYLPYAYSKYDFYPELETSEKYFDNGKVGTNLSLPIKDTDAVLIGMPYENRVQWVQQLRERGVSVIFENGPVFDEARQLYNRGKIGLNWSSLDDLNCRAFELAAMKLAPVMNLVSDIGLFFEQGTDYLGFKSMHEAVENVLWLKDHDRERNDMSTSAYNKVKPHTYDIRVQKILEECGFI